MDCTIYLIPGVGANDKIFQNLDLPDAEIVHLKWPRHKKKESIQDYVKKLLPQIRKDTKPVLIGMSFGGIVATELAKLINPHKVILISTIKTYHERPFKIMFMNSVKFHRLIPGKLVLNLRFWMQWVLGKLNRHDFDLIEEMIEAIDIDFNEWAVDQVVHWKNEEIPANVVHIHGTRDRIFPRAYIHEPCHWIKGGTHFMVVNRAKEISKIIKRELASARLVKMGTRKPLKKAS
jgi:pimeloyl-ACP methyl ester carboxylesterase